MNASVLLIYTGGTIGMMQDPQSGQLKPFDFNNLSNQLPELNRLEINLDAVSFENPIDSSTMGMNEWKKLASIIEENYNNYSGFVILHGSDTMAFSASVLSFMLEDLNKPVILTGSQLPIGVIRTDGKENLITAIEIAATTMYGEAVVREVAIYFEYQLFRGNRTLKFSSEQFDAFISPNYPPLAEAGVNITFNYGALGGGSEQQLKVHKELGSEIAVLHLFPGIQKEAVKAVLNTEGVKVILLLTFGAGNAPLYPWFLELLQQSIQKEVIIVNVSQCEAGAVAQGKYQTSSALEEMGVLSGLDITFEAAIAKSMYLLGNVSFPEDFKKLFGKSLRGELTSPKLPETVK